jgi:hypothetical protein
MTMRQCFVLLYLCTSTFLMNSMAAEGHVITLRNDAGIDLEVNPELGIYTLRYKSQEWFGPGFVSALSGGRWYRSASVIIPEPKTFQVPDGRLSLISVKQGSDSDGLGSFDFVNLVWEVPEGGIRLMTGFHLYRDKPFLVFVQEFPNGYKSYANGKWTVPSVAFPDFMPDIEKSRKDLYSWVYGGLDVQRFAYGPATSLSGNLDVLLLSDDKLSTVILSPFANYLVATQQSIPVATRDESETVKGEIACGIEGLVQDIPIGFKHEHILVVGDQVTPTIQRWGRALLEQAGKSVPSKYASDNLKYLTYWDDYGAYYNAFRFKADGFKTYEDIILGVAKDAKDHGLRIGAYQVQDSDQMLFDKGLFEPRPDLFPHGLKWLHEQLGVPLEAYTSWVASDSPYRKKYPYHATPRGNILGWPEGSMGDVFYSASYWEDAARKLSDWGVSALQQDYLSTYDGDPVMMASVDRMNEYLRNQATALQKRGILMEYCMTFARNVMQSTENPIAVTLQSSADHHVYMAEPKPEHRDDDPYMWKQMIFASALYGAVGLWPSRDNVQTVADPNAWEDVLIANLMGGEIQLGHKIGEANFDLLRKTYRDGDQILLKPDQPIVPLDRCFLEQCAVGWTDSTVSQKRWYYVLSLPPSGRLDRLYADDLHLNGRWIVYDYDTESAFAVDRNTPINLRSVVKHQYLVLAPLFPNEMTVLGDTSKFVTMADMRIASVESVENGLEVGVISSEHHNPIITGYSESQPEEVVEGQNVLPEVSSLDRLERADIGWFRDAQSKLWYVKPDFRGKQQPSTVTFRLLQ